MTLTESTLLKVIKASIQNAPTEDPIIGPDEWDEILHLARQQEILPLVLNHIYGYKSYKKIGRDKRDAYLADAIGKISRQVTQTNEFLTILLHAQKQGLDPIVLKGIVCRDLYPAPMLRPSVDEDLLIPAEHIAHYHQFLLTEGLFCDDPHTDTPTAQSLSRAEIEAADELSYHRENSPTYIELHTTLFNPQSDAYGEFNTLFPNLHEHTMRIQIQDVSLLTLDPTYHLLYLFLHAFKHFVHSGIGIRPVCDIGIFAEQYAAEIDWDLIRDSLESVHAGYYCRALLRIVQIHLLPDAEFFRQIENWGLEDIDVEPLLEDILASGIHGASSMTRLHSSNLTLHSVASKKRQSKGRRKENPIASGSIRGMLTATLLPPAKKLESRYPYLKKIPLLLPIAWLQRGIKYCQENHNKCSISEATSGLRLGNQRVRLLEKYRIISRD